MKQRRWTFTVEQRNWLRQWHRAMQRTDPKTLPPPPSLRALDLGDRARLRRCTNIAELLAERSVHLLVQGFPKERGDNRRAFSENELYQRLPVVAGVLAAAREDTGKQTVSLIGRLGHGGRDGSPKLGEIRFKRLHSESKPEGLLRLWRRIVALADNAADVAQLADDLYTWLEQLERPPRNPNQSVRFHWAYDYYQQPRPKEAAKTTPIDPEAAA